MTQLHVCNHLKRSFCEHSSDLEMLFMCSKPLETGAIISGTYIGGGVLNYSLPIRIQIFSNCI